LQFAVFILQFAISSSAAAAGRQAPGTFKPTFEVSPGAVIDFSFQVASPGGARLLKVEPVGMIQQETGQVLPDESGGDLSAIRMISPPQIELRPDRPQQIRGRLTVANDGSSFQAYGLLVTDLGTPGAPPAIPQEGQTQMAVRFVTRYLLRVEVMVRGVRNESASRLQVVAQELVDVKGRAVARALIHNPTGTAFEFEARCRLIQSNGAAVGPAFKLAMPVRAQAAEKLRYRSRLLNSSRVQVLAPVPDPILPGDYRMIVELLVDGRPAVSQALPIVVGPDQFPAQSAVVAQIMQDVRVSPSQIELSLRPRGSRIVPLKITNASDRPVTVKLEAGDLGTRHPTSAVHSPAADWLIIRPQTMTLAAGATRSAMVSLRSGDHFQTPQYTGVRLGVMPDDGGAAGAVNLPVALLTRGPAIARLETQSLTWDASTQPAAFTVPVHNAGSVHIPLHGVLTLTDRFGRSTELVGGFGQWLLPGESSSLRFPLSVPLPPGPYTVKGRIQAGEGAEPLRIEERIVLEPGDTLAGSSR
jgi:hypothetical protein